MQYKASNTAEPKSPDTNTMAAATPPIAIGTRGTVGSLVRREIEYFTKLELDRRGCSSSSSSKPRGQIVGMTSSGSCTTQSSRSSFWFLIMTWRRKKRRGSSRGFFSSLCSAAEVAQTNGNRPSGIPGFNYRILKDDMNNLSI